MGGPGCNVILPRALDSAQIACLDNLIDSISSSRSGKEDFWVSNSIPLGGDYQGKCRHFTIIREPPTEAEYPPGMMRAIENAIGYSPQEIITLIALRGGREDHRILGALAMHLAAQFNGMIDFGDVLYTPGEKLPGKLVCVLYWEDGEKHAIHLGDSEFMRAWLKHPAFYMMD